jgi:hypothetical protein
MSRGCKAMTMKRIQSSDEKSSAMLAFLEQERIAGARNTP